MCTSKLYIYFLVLFMFAALIVKAEYSVNVTQVSNGAACTGQISVIVLGDAGPFDVRVYPSISHIYSNDILIERVGLSPGGYYLGEVDAYFSYQSQPVVVITDRLGCEFIYDDIYLNCNCENVEIITGFIQDPAYNDGKERQFVNGLIISHPSSCFSNDGFIRLTGTVLQNGIAPITYEWDDPQIQIGKTFHTNISHGKHILTVTDASGCSDQVQINFKSESKPEVFGLELCPSCLSPSSGYIKLNILAEAPVFDQDFYHDIDIFWHPLTNQNAGSIIIEDSNPQFPHVAYTIVEDISPGRYCLTITEKKVDLSGVVLDQCEHEECFTVEEITPDGPFTVLKGDIKPSCRDQANGLINLNVSGGVKFSSVECSNYSSTADYLFTWSYEPDNPEYLTDNYNSNEISAGFYSVTVEDYCGDIVILDNIEVEEYPEITYDLSYDKECHCSSVLNIGNVLGGQSPTGNIHVEVRGPDGYVMPLDINTMSSNNSRILDGLCEGRYYLKFTDEEGCYQEEEVVVETFPEIQFSIVDKDNVCLWNNDFFLEFGYGPDNAYTPWEFETGNIDIDVSWSNFINYSTDSEFSWSDLNGVTSVTSNISNEIDRDDLANYFYANVNTNSLDFNVVVTTSFLENGVTTVCSNDLSNYLGNPIEILNTIEVRKQRGNSGSWEDVDCSCPIYAYCNYDVAVYGTYDLTEEVKRCDIRSNLTDLDADCGYYDCYCNFPSQFDEIPPGPSSGGIPKYPMHCEGEELDFSGQVMVECQADCSYSIDCIDWDSEPYYSEIGDGWNLYNIVWNPPTETYDAKCVFTVEIFSGGTGIVHSTDATCPSLNDLTFQFNIDRTGDCPAPVDVSSTIEYQTGIDDAGNPTSSFFNGNFTIEEVEDTDTWTLVNNDLDLLDNTIFNCSSILTLTFTYDNSEPFTIPNLTYDFTTCIPFSVTFSALNAACGGRDFDFSFPCTGESITFDEVVENEACPTNISSPTLHNPFNTVLTVTESAGQPTITSTTSQSQDARNLIWTYQGVLQCVHIDAFNFCDTWDNCPNCGNFTGCDKDVFITDNESDIHHIHFTDSLYNGVVITSATLNDNISNIVPFVSGYSPTGFDLSIYPLNSLDSKVGIAAGKIAYQYMDSGIIDTDDLVIESGTINMGSGTPSNISFDHDFTKPPVLITTPLTTGGKSPNDLIVSNITTSGFQAVSRFSGNESDMDQLSYMAIEEGLGLIDDRLIFASTRNVVTNRWYNVPTSQISQSFDNSNLWYFGDFISNSSTNRTSIVYRVNPNGTAQMKVEELPGKNRVLPYNSGILNYVIMEPAMDCCDDLFIERLIVNDIACNSNNGEIGMSLSGGQSPYTYQWNTGVTGSTNDDIYLDNLAPGTYSITITDAESCSLDTTLIINDSQFLNLEQSIISTDCQGHGSINVIPHGGVAPYNYNWSTGEMTSSISVNTGTYQVTVTGSNGCYGVKLFNVYPLSVADFELNDVICGTQGTGSITGSAKYGVAPYSYLWENGSTNPERFNLNTGTYSLTITDSQGCTLAEEFLIEDISQFSFSQNGGDEGLEEGRFLYGGTTIHWDFRPVNVSDQLIIVSDVEGTLVDTGPVTQLSSCECDGFLWCSCSTLFMGDYAGQAVSLPIGTGNVSPSQLECSYNSSIPKRATTLSGSYTLSSDSNITFIVNGGVCSSGTAWGVDFYCGSQQNTLSQSTFRDLEQEELKLRSSLNDLANFKELINIYPNPAKSEFHISSNSNFIIDDIQVLDSNGKLILSQNIGEKSILINSMDWNAGIYFIRTAIGGKIELNKLVILGN